MAVYAFLVVLLPAEIFTYYMSIFLGVRTVLVFWWLCTISTLVVVCTTSIELSLELMSYNALSSYFYYFWLYHAFILLYLDNNLSLIIFIVDRSILSYSSYSRFSSMFFYYSSRLDSMRVIISKSSIIAPTFCKSPINNYSSVIQSSRSLVKSPKFLSVVFFNTLILGAPGIGWICFNFSHVGKAIILDKSSVTDYSEIWKHTVSYWSKLGHFTHSYLVSWV